MASRDELYAKFGITAEAAQLFETEIGTLLLRLKGKEKDWYKNPDPESATAFFTKVDKSTLGNLLTQMQKLMDLHGPVTIDDNLKDLFQSALKTRNELFHGFYLRHDFKIQSDIGRDDMIADLEVMHTELFNAWQTASGLDEVFNALFEYERET